MRVLVGCEESQAICIAFRERGHEAYSCDIQECSGGRPEWHIQEDVLAHLNDGWDMLIGHPPCTYINYIGIAWWNDPGRCEKRLKALDFFRKMWEAPIDKICLENPKGCASPTIAKYTQIIQPYYFGDPHLKTTCLWLKGLPPLVWTKENTLFEDATAVMKPDPLYIQENGKKRYYTDMLSGGNDKQRSKTFPGIARAMAEQWG